MTTTAHSPEWLTAVGDYCTASVMACASGDIITGLVAYRYLCDLPHPECAQSIYINLCVELATREARSRRTTDTTYAPADFDPRPDGQAGQWGGPFGQLIQTAFQICATYANGDTDTSDALIRAVFVNRTQSQIAGFLCETAGQAVRDGKAQP